MAILDNRVVRISVDAVIDGEKFDVTEANIVLGVNAIPRIELSCPPSEPGRSKPLKPVVERPTISDYSDLYRRLSKKAEGLSVTGYVKIDVMEEDGETDSITLRDWILSDVGMSRVSATAAPYLTMVLQHPICKLTKVGSIYEDPRSLLNRKITEKTAGCSKLLEIIEAVYDAIQPDALFYPSPNAYPPIYRHALVKKEHKPSTYLVDETSIFLGKFGGMIRLAQSTAKFVLPDMGGTSTWDLLLKMSGLVLVSITQDQSNNYTQDKLVIQPTQPWKAHTITLDQDWCASTDIFGSDPFKIAGVMARGLGPYNDPENQGIFINANANKVDKPSITMYVPTPFVNPSLAGGRIVKTSTPTVLDMAFREDAPKGPILASATTKIYEQRKGSYTKALEAYCKAVYEITAASMSRATARMALYFHDASGNLIIPGSTCKFTSGLLDIYYGYIMNIVHHVSVDGGNSTTVNMAYVRPYPDYKVRDQTAIPIGSPNPTY